MLKGMYYLDRHWKASGDCVRQAMRLQQVFRANVHRYSSNLEIDWLVALEIAGRYAQFFLPCCRIEFSSTQLLVDWKRVELLIQMMFDD